MEKSLSVPTATSFREVPARLLEVNRSVINGYLGRTRGGKVSFTHIIGYAVVRAIADGAALHEWRAGGDGQATWQAAPGQRWCAVEIRGADGNMLALSNPIFCAASA